MSYRTPQKPLSSSKFRRTPIKNLVTKKSGGSSSSGKLNPNSEDYVPSWMLVPLKPPDFEEEPVPPAVVEPDQDSTGQSGALEMMILECSVCCERYDDRERVPRVLHCGHTFCTSCLTQLCVTHKAQNNDFMSTYISCPHDRKHTNVTHGVLGLPQNFALLELRPPALNPEGIRELKDNGNAAHICQACPSQAPLHQAVVYCLDCREGLCGIAAKYHERYKTP